MKLNKYQELTEETVVYPAQSAIEYLAIGLNDEAGEVGGAVKKYVRDDYDEEELSRRLQQECGDVLWYWARLLDEVDIDAEDVMEDNIDKLFDRMDRDAIQGDGDER